MSIPVPKRAPGYTVGDKNATLHIEFYGDYQCPYTQKAWTKVFSVVKGYLDKVCITYHPVVVVGHRQAYHMIRAALAVAGEDVDKFIAFSNRLFQHQHQFTNAEFRDKTEIDLCNLLADHAEKFCDEANLVWQSRDKFFTLLNSDEVYLQAKTAIRAGVKNGVWATPTFFINGAEAVRIGSSTTVEEWRDTIQGLL
jgi:protein-disulfide isomerase